VLAGAYTTRKPMLLLWLSILFLLRLAERQLLGLLIHEPPRSYSAYPNFQSIPLGLFLKSVAVVAKYRRAEDGQTNRLGIFSGFLETCGQL
jgi:hypothetical protein